MDDLLTALDKVLAERKTASPDSSYVASLNAEGLNKILEKVGEEATEVILAAKDAAESGNSAALVNEVADLWFHTMVMLAQSPTAIFRVIKEAGAAPSVAGACAMLLDLQ